MPVGRINVNFALVTVAFLSVILPSQSHTILNINKSKIMFR